MGSKYSIGLSPATSFMSMTLTPLLFFTVPPAGDPLLTSPFVSSFSLFPFSQKVLQNFGSNHLPILLTAIFLYFPAPINVLLSSVCRKLAGMTLILASNHTFLLQKNILLFLFPLLSSSPLRQQMRPNLSFLLIASNATLNLVVYWSGRSGNEKKAKLFLSLAEETKSARLAYRPLDMLPPLSPKPS